MQGFFLWYQQQRFVQLRLRRTLQRVSLKINKNALQNNYP
jgi:hypothetical protein